MFSLFLLLLFCADCRLQADGEIQHLLCDTYVRQPPHGPHVLISSEAGYLWQLLRDSINVIDSKPEQQGPSCDNI